MCRLLAYTDTQFRKERLHWIDRLLLVAQTDGAQDDGFGITNGQFMHKTARPYSASIPVFLNTEFNQQDVILAHLRKASPATGRKDKEAHPYMFTIRGQPMYCMHNGYIAGTGTHDWHSDDPDTDSWRAFRRLAGIVEKAGVISAPVIEEWLSVYTATSQLAILILWEGVLYAFRHKRPLHIADIGNGVIIHTSKEVLNIWGEYIKYLNAVELEPVLELPENNLVIFTKDTTIFEQVEVKFADTSSGFRQISLPAAENKEEAAAIVPVSTAASLPSASKISAGVWRDVMKNINPMRMPVYLNWLCHSMDIEVQAEFKDMLSSISTEDLTLFTEMISLWEPQQRVLIDAWNKIIEKGADLLAHSKIFGVDWFWYNPEFLITANKEGLENFQSAVASGIIQHDLYDLCRLPRVRVCELALNGQ